MTRKKGKAGATFVVVLALCGAVLVTTNPDGTAYEQYLRTEVLKDAGRQKDTRKRIVEAVLSTILPGMVTAVTRRQDYVLWSYYVSDIGIERVETIGILGNFYVLSRYGVRQ